METTQSGTDETQQSRGNGGWIFPLLLAAVFLALLGFSQREPQGTDPAGRNQQAAEWTPSPQPTGQTVSLEIDFSNGAKRTFTALPWHEQMTVSDLMQAARQFQPSVDYVQSGEGERGFLSSLEGVANQGGGGKNWIYQVNGQHAHVSFCLEIIEPDARVLWTFTDELYNEDSKADP